MYKDIESIIAAGMQLGLEDRLRIAETLLQSIPIDDVTEAWLIEAEKRQARWNAGIELGVDGTEVIRGLRERAGR